MKNKILYAALVIAIIAVSRYNMYLAQTKKMMTELTLANVEALAGIDDFPEVPFLEDAPAVALKRCISHYYIEDQITVNDTVAHIYSTPVTEVRCEGTGEVKCLEMRLFGERFYNRTEIIN